MLEIQNNLPRRIVPVDMEFTSVEHECEVAIRGVEIGACVGIDRQGEGKGWVWDIGVVEVSCVCVL